MENKLAVFVLMFQLKDTSSIKNFNSFEGDIYWVDKKSCAPLEKGDNANICNAHFFKEILLQKCQCCAEIKLGAIKIEVCFRVIICCIAASLFINFPHASPPMHNK